MPLAEDRQTPDRPMLNPPAPNDRTQRSRLKADRREQLLHVAAHLFAERGFGAVSIEELGATAGVTGPALYRHFSSKQDVLATLLVGVSRRLLDGSRAVVESAPGPEEALRGLVRFHTDFALSDPDLIRVQDRDLASLAPSEGRLVRRLQGAYVELWVSVIVRSGAAPAARTARIKAHAVLGLLNSTPHSARHRSLAATRHLLEAMALAGLLAPPGEAR